MIDFNNKRILFIGIGFYDYEDTIKRYIEARHAIVTYFVSLCKSWRLRVANRLGLKNVCATIQNSYLKNKILHLDTNYDYILIIKAEGFSEGNILLLKKKYKDIPIILYQFDSFERLKNSDLLLKYFNNIYTFDRIDAIRYNLKFRPLFYRTKLSPCNSFKYAISFAGWAHSDRYEMLSHLREQFMDLNLSFKFLIFTSRFSYLINRYIKRIYKKKDADMFIFKSICYNDYVKLCFQSNVILDLSHPNQTGLTMRAIESLGFCRKLLTTNKDIISYTNIDKSVYKVLDRKEMSVDFSFLSNCEPISSFDLECFSIDTFVEELFG